MFKIVKMLVFITDGKDSDFYCLFSIKIYFLMK